MTQHALARLDGGPGDGMVLRLDQSSWAPLGLLSLEIDGQDVTYVLAKQRRPDDGVPWRYVPAGSADAAIEDDDDVRLPMPNDPNDD